MDSKKWYLSKTIWINLIAAAAMGIQLVVGEVWLDTEVQVGILAIVNLAVRLITKQPLAK